MKRLTHVKEHLEALKVAINEAIEHFNNDGDEKMSEEQANKLANEGWSVKENEEAYAELMNLTLNKRGELVPEETTKKNGRFLLMKAGKQEMADYLAFVGSTEDRADLFLRMAQDNRKVLLNIEKTYRRTHFTAYYTLSFKDDTWSLQFTKAEF